MIPISLSDLQRLQLPLPEMVTGRIGLPHDTFTCFAYERLAHIPRGADAVVLVSKRARARALQEIAAHDGHVVMVAAPGDATFRPEYLRGTSVLPENLIAVYTTNNRFDDPRVVNVPLGLRPNKTRHVRFVQRTVSGARDGLVYGNFTVNDSHYRAGPGGESHIRQRLVERLAGEPWTTFDVSDTARGEPRALIPYLASIARHRFVLSPEGNGVDCYRHWESLYLGAIPIVMSSRAMAGFTNLPMLFTEDYSELTEEYLEEQWTLMRQRTFDLAPLLASTYRNHFLARVAQLDAPRFVCLDAGEDWWPRVFRMLDRSSRSELPDDLGVSVPPFVAADSLSEPRRWTVTGGSAVVSGEDGLRIVAGSGPNAAAMQQFGVLEGVVYRVSGTTDRPVRIEILNTRARQVLAALDHAGGAFSLGFSVDAEERPWLRFAVAGEVRLEALRVDASPGG